MQHPQHLLQGRRSWGPSRRPADGTCPAWRGGGGEDLWLRDPGLRRVCLCRNKLLRQVHLPYGVVRTPSRRLR